MDEIQTRFPLSDGVKNEIVGYGAKNAFEFAVDFGGRWLVNERTTSWPATSPPARRCGSS